LARVLILAPHPDDETLGCGGTALRHVAAGDEVHWLIATDMTEPAFTPQRIATRQTEIDAVMKLYGFATLQRLGLAAAQVDRLPISDIVARIGDIFRKVGPEILYLPYHGDAHSDHRILSDAAMSAAKWFRLPCIRAIYAYETLSETNFAHGAVFAPNVYVDIDGHLDRKLNAMAIYASEHAPHPFPRSIEAIRALAVLRGSEAGFAAAEAFMLLKDRKPA
jgi:LmbE family N-acetylglucosaminyl deacetylase